MDFENSAKLACYPEVGSIYGNLFVLQIWQYIAKMDKFGAFVVTLPLVLFNKYSLLKPMLLFFSIGNQTMVE